MHPNTHPNVIAYYEAKQKPKPPQPEPLRSTPENEHILARFASEYLEVHNITPKRRVEQLSLLRRFALTLGDRTLIAMRPEDLRNFIGAAMKAGRHPNTGRNHLGMFRSFITWAHDAELIDDLATAQLSLVRRPRGSSAQVQPKPYRSEEIPVLYATLAEKFPPLPLTGRGSQMMRSYERGRATKLHSKLWRHAKRLQFEAQIALALQCGLRLSELYNLTIPALHPDNEELVVLTAKQGPGRQIKRAIPYMSHARDCVEQWLDFRLALGAEHEHPWLCLHHGGGDRQAQLAPMSFGKFGDSLGKDLGTYWKWHRLRHTAATEWLRAGVPLEKVRRFMGHASIEQTLAYVEILKGDMTAAFDEAEAKFAASLRLPISPEEKAA